jgi:EAL domain-containing protein (putative c-di-GMP-specific phosphodiesterase class I)
VIELTEHIDFGQYPGLQGALVRLRKSGVRLAVDDAGSGYSSLTHILKLAPELIKLDRELVCGIDIDPVRRALVTALVLFAADTGAEILAEGIETSDELDVVRRLGVRYSQGYYLGRPAALKDVGIRL